MADILSVAISSLHAASSMMANSANNVSNSATAGYHKRRVDIQTRPSVAIGTQLIGTGVKVGMTKRTVESLQQSLHRENLTSEQEFATRSEFSGAINDLLANSTTGISEGINSFFMALQQLSDNPGSITNREVVLNQARALEKKITTMDARLADLATDINFQLQEAISLINTTAIGVVKLNKQIANSMSSGIEPTDLLDQRDMLIDDLAKVISVQTLAQPDGSVNVFIGDNQALVIGTQSLEYAGVRNARDPLLYDIQCVSGATRTVTSHMTGARIGGLCSIRTDGIDDVRSKINKIVLSLAVSVNAQHKLGLDLQGNFGREIFTDYNGYTMQTQRSMPDSANVGTGQFVVRVNDIFPQQTGPFTVFSSPSNLVNAGALTQVLTNHLSINGTNITAPVAGNDTVSTVDNARSAIAIATAITNSVGNTGITATAAINSLCLGTFTAGAFAAGEFAINGVSIISTGANITTLVRDINAQTPTTGVRAIANGTKLDLVADDGRNIQLVSDGTATGTFQFFAANGTVALNKVQRAGIILQHPDTAITIAGTNPDNAGITAGTTPTTSSSLTDSDYVLSYDGTTYTLTRQSDSVVVASTTATTINADGVQIQLESGVVQAGDSFLIRPTIGAAANFAVLIANNSKLAMASPIKVSKTNTMAGSTAKITRGKITNATGIPLATSGTLGNAFSATSRLTPPIRIEFFNDSDGQPTIYRVFDTTNSATGVQIGQDQRYDPNANNQIFPLVAVTNTNVPGPNPTYVYDPGYRVAITGEVVAGDVFTVDYNTNASGDDGNAAELRKLQTSLLLSGNTTNYQSEYNNLVSKIGSLAHTDDINYEAAQSLSRASSDTLQSQSGVNLDEEATNIIRFQQFYQASAQVISIARTLFDSLLSAVAA